MTEVWYYEYTLKIWDEIDEREELRSGVVSATSMAEAMNELKKWYTNEIMEVHMLKVVTEGHVFDFQSVMEDTDFDFTIAKKV